MARRARVVCNLGCILFAQPTGTECNVKELSQYESSNNGTGKRAFEPG